MINILISIVILQELENDVSKMGTEHQDYKHHPKQLGLSPSPICHAQQ